MGYALFQCSYKSAHRRNTWVAYAIHACVSFENTIIQLHIIHPYFIPSPFCIAPTSSVGWVSVVFMPNHFSLVSSHHMRWWMWKIAPKLVVHFLGDQFALKDKLWICSCFHCMGLWVDGIDFCNWKAKCKLLCGPPFSTPNILWSNWVMATTVHIINPMFCMIVKIQWLEIFEGLSL